jgi:hypothetical protein
MKIDRDALIEIINEHASDALWCSRVWSAWSYGTMTPDDFIQLSETEFAEELAGSIIKYLEVIKND